MEILQTIWNALTTENQNLIKIISIPLGILEAFLTMLLFTTILDISSTKKQKALYVSIFSIIAVLSITVIPSPFNTFVNLISCPILVILIFKTSILKAILAEVVPYAFFCVIGATVANLYTVILKISNEVFSTTPIHKFCGSLFIYLFVYLSYRFIKYFNFTMKDVKLNQKNSRLLILNFIVGILGLFVESIISKFYTDYLPIQINFFSVFVLFIYFLITLHSLSRTMKLEQTTASLEEERLYNKTLNILYDNIRGFKHDFGNIVQSIGGYIATENMDGLKDYYNDLMKDCRKSNNLSILNPELVQNPAAYSLITSKYHKAEDKGISMEVEVFSNLANVNMKTYELTRVLGILLDNAIEASNKCNDVKKINLTIRKEPKLNRQLITISNTYTNKDVNTDKIFEKGYTSKNDSDGKSHGLGLWEVRKVLKKNDNLNLFTTKSDEFFTQQLEIYN